MSVRPGPRTTLAVLLAGATLVTGCAVGGAGASQRPPGEPTEAPSPSSAANPASAQEPKSQLASTQRAQTAGTIAQAGPSTRDWRRARAMVRKMSLAERAGQTIVATYAGTGAPVGLVRDLHLGGVIVMGNNVASTKQVQRSNRRLSTSVKRPLVISVDQEGGIVARVGPPATEFPTFMTHGAADDRTVSRAAAEASGAELRDLGFTMVFAPVADVTIGPSDPTIGSRSAGSRPGLVSRVVQASTAGYVEAGVVPVLKHFPGHGSVPADSHLTLPVQRASKAALRTRDLVPFARAAHYGAPAVMLAHIDVRAIDPGTPSSLSKRVSTGLLRRDLGFHGLAVTDSLGMAAIAKRYGSGEAAVRALRAGADVLLMPPSPAAARAAVVAAVRQGRLPGARVKEAAQRVLATMLAAERTSPGVRKRSASSVGRHRAESYDLSLAGMAIVAGRCRGPIVGRAIRIAGGDAKDRSRLATAARRAGLGVGSGQRVLLLGGAGSAGSADVVVALDAPYGLGRSSATRAKVALHGRTQPAFSALVDVLRGKVRAKGQLSVGVPGVPRRGC